MTDKAVISAYTHRSLESQRDASGDMPVFVLPEDLPQLFRKTIRKAVDRLHVESLAILADKEDDFRDFIAQAKKRGCQIVSREDNQTFLINTVSTDHWVKWWKDARRKGSAKIGGERGGAAKKKAVEERAKDFTKAEWVDGTIKNAQLSKKYDMSINTLKRIAGDKGWGRDRQHAIWRAEQSKARKLQLPVKK